MGSQIWPDGAEMTGQGTGGPSDVDGAEKKGGQDTDGHSDPSVQGR